MEIEKKCTSSSTSEGEPYLTADKKQISVPFRASYPVKTIEINFSGPKPAQIAELFIHTKEPVPGKKWNKNAETSIEPNSLWIIDFDQSHLYSKIDVREHYTLSSMG